MAASAKTTEEVLDILVEEIGSEKLIKVFSRLLSVKGNSSFKTTIANLSQRLHQRFDKIRPLEQETGSLP